MNSGSWSSYVEAGAMGDDYGVPDDEPPVVTVGDLIAELTARCDRLEAALAEQRIQCELWASLTTAAIDRLVKRVAELEKERG